MLRIPVLLPGIVRSPLSRRVSSSGLEAVELPDDKHMVDGDESEYDDLLFAVRRSVRHHRHRERFLYGVYNMGAVLTVFFGLATIAAHVAELPPGWAWVRLLVVFLMILAGCSQLVPGAARAARRHDSLAVSYLALEKDLLRVGPSLTQEALVELQSRRLDIEAVEPPVYRVLDAICHDELVTALGIDPSQRSNVTRWQRLWRHVLDVGAHRLRKQADVLQGRGGGEEQARE